jgi:hypothetical protein
MSAGATAESPVLSRSAPAPAGARAVISARDTTAAAADEEPPPPSFEREVPRPWEDEDDEDPRPRELREGASAMRLDAAPTLRSVPVSRAPDADAPRPLGTLGTRGASTDAPWTAEPPRRPAAAPVVAAPAARPLRPEDLVVPSIGGISFADYATAVRKRRPTLGGSLLQVRPLTFVEGAIVLGCDTTFDEQQLSSPEVRSFLEHEAAQLFGRPMSVEVRRVAAPAPEAPHPATLTELEDNQRRALKAERNTSARQNAAVRQVQDILGARIARVKVVEDD